MKAAISTGDKRNDDPKEDSHYRPHRSEPLSLPSAVYKVRRYLQIPSLFAVLGPVLELVGSTGASHVSS